MQTCNCEKCGDEMPIERTELGLFVCVKCSKVKKVYGFNDYDKRSGGALCLVGSFRAFKEVTSLVDLSEDKEPGSAIEAAEDLENGEEKVSPEETEVAE